MNVRLSDGTVRCAEHFDASTYEGMTDAPCLYCQVPAESADDGWNVRQVASVHRTARGVKLVQGPNGPVWKVTAWGPGTTSLASSEMESTEGLNKLIDDLGVEYGYRADCHEVTDSTYRWTWEGWNSEGTHVSDMIIASRIGD